ncbi:NUDIX domain-containing protein [Streptomyces sp. NPDC015414]|uniref:NUDIX domain-containing protein n=1 Tax=Streptomyces sp. NPDC015414 TaxID=3364957 RepID=UPI0036FB7BAF
MIVCGSDGVLFGRHRRGTCELAGGTDEPGETFAEAAVREFNEEAGLLAVPDEVQVLSTLLDRLATSSGRQFPSSSPAGPASRISAWRTLGPGGSGPWPPYPNRISYQVRSV